MITQIPQSKRFIERCRNSQRLILSSGCLTSCIRYWGKYEAQFLMGKKASSLLDFYSRLENAGTMKMNDKVRQFATIVRQNWCNVVSSLIWERHKNILICSQLTNCFNLCAVFCILSSYSRHYWNSSS